MLINERISIHRDQQGIPHIEAQSEKDMFWGQGWVHAADRGLQMALMRILAQGRGSELLEASDEMYEIDTFFRRMNWHGNTQKEIDSLPEEMLSHVQAYCDGVNERFAQKFPWELKLLGVKPEPWDIHGLVTMARMIGYITLAQSQWEIERLLVEMVKADVPQTKLEEFFPGLLTDLDIPLIKKITLHERLVKPETLWNKGLPRFMASNNWVVSGKKTSSGHPMLVNDPHLEVNRLPNVWMELVMSSPENHFIGASMPGVPGMVVGRNKNVAWGATYAFVDACDSWIEKCKDGKCYRESQGNQEWQPFHQRVEIIKLKKKEPVTVTFYENEHGVLEGNPNIEGYYLATRWAPGESGSKAIKALMSMSRIENVDDAMNNLGQIESAWNFVFADTSGNIGFQISGMAPKRRPDISGLVPLPGWKKENDWQGFLTVEELPRIKNPEKGYFATANQDLNAYGIAKPINMPMGAYRADRINSLLEKGECLTPEDMFTMHADLFSLQAESFMTILKPLLPDTPQGKGLSDWDYCYDADSQGAFLFETFYKALFRDVFGKKEFGEKAADFMMKGLPIFIDFYGNIDQILLSENSAWFEGETREQIYKRVAEEALKIEPKAWGDTQQFMMSHILFGGKLPRFIGFDRGPIKGKGGRATIHQGQIYKSAGRVTTFMPGLRLVIPMELENTFSCMAGGPSDRRFSKWYVSDLQNWKSYRYKSVKK